MSEFDNRQKRQRAVQSSGRNSENKGRTVKKSRTQPVYAVKRQVKRKKPASMSKRSSAPKNYYNDGFNPPPREYKEAQANRRKIRENANKPISPLKRRVIHIITYSSIVLVILAIGVALSLTVLFKTEEINVSGETRYNADEIVAISNLSLGENIFLANKNNSAKAIVDNFPYVDTANVTFKIPNMLNIEVTDAKPAYLIQLDKQYIVVSAKGRILEIVDKKIKGIPVLIGPKISTKEPGKYVAFEEKETLTILNDIVSCIESNKFKNFDTINISNTAQIKLIYDNRITINIGVPEKISYKVRTAMSIITTKLDPNNLRTIKGILDVSHCDKNKRSFFHETTYDIPSSQGITKEPSSTEQSTTQTQSTEQSASQENTDEMTYSSTHDSYNGENGFSEPTENSYSEGNGGFLD